MYLCKLASSNVPTNKEEAPKNKSLWRELNKERTIRLSPKTQLALGLGGLAGAAFNIGSNPVLGAVRGMGTTGGWLGGSYGGKLLADELMKTKYLSGFDDTSKSILKTGLGLGTGVLGAILANRLLTPSLDE